MTRALATKLIALVLVAVVSQNWLKSTLLAAPMASVDVLTDGRNARRARLRKGHLVLVPGVDLAKRPAR